MIFITGITGFIGGNLANYLIRNDYAVSGLLRDHGKKSHLHDKIKFIEGDIRDHNLSKNDLSDISCFIHCASVINPPDQKESTLIESNINGTVNVLNWIKSRGKNIKKFIYISSVGAMGRIYDPPVDENYYGKVINAYQSSKKESEFIVREFCLQNDIKYLILRPAWVYGPHDKRVLKFIKAIAKKRFIRVGKCNTLIHPVYIDDLVQGIHKSILMDANDEILIIAGPETYTINDTIDIISDIVGVKIPDLKFPYSIMYIIAFISEFFFPIIGVSPPLFRRRLDFFRENQGFNINKAREMINYKPEYGLKKGMEETIKFYKDHNWV